MEDHLVPVFLIALVLLQSDCAVIDTITANQAIKDGKTIVSKGRMFELGFFSPQNSKNRYLGIWYKKISTGTVVWVANRETPITDTSGTFKVSSNGNLVVLSGGNTMVWSSSSTASVQSNSLVVVVQLLDTGNLVVWDKKSANQKLIWQSFDYPSDTFLAGMKLGKNFVTGIGQGMTAWKSADDPSPGLYGIILDTNGYPQLFWWRGTSLQSRLGPWNGLRFSGYPVEKDTEFVVNEKEIYHKYELTGSAVQRRLLTWDGKTQLLQWIE